MTHIDVVPTAPPPPADRFFSRHATRALTPDERVTVLELMELERHTQPMYTSCGCYFDEVSGIETIQIIAYAGRGLQLAAKLFGRPPGVALESRFLEILAKAKPPPRDRQRLRALPPLRHPAAASVWSRGASLRHQLHLPHLPGGAASSSASTHAAMRMRPSSSYDAAKSRSTAPTSPLPHHL